MPKWVSDAVNKLRDFQRQSPIWSDGGVALGGSGPLLWQCLVLLLKLFSIKWRWTLFSTHLLQCSCLLKFWWEGVANAEDMLVGFILLASALSPPYGISLLAGRRKHCAAILVRAGVRHLRAEGMSIQWQGNAWGHSPLDLIGVVIQLLFLPAATGSIKINYKNNTQTLVLVNL